MNRTLIRLTTLPARLPRTLSKAALLAAPATLLASHAFAQAANTLGGRMQAASTDLTTGGGFVLEILGYLLGGAAMLAGGAFLTASLFGTFASQSVAGAGPSNTGTAQQMTFQ